MENFKELLDEADRWFRSVFEKYSDRMRCGRGCTLCCYGLFDISLPEAVLVLEAMRRLPEGVRAAVRTRAIAIDERIRTAFPGLSRPGFLDELEEEEIDHIVERVGSPRCPLLSGSEECLIYDRRPLACRLEGIPMVDAGDGPFGDWCELNFTEGIPPGAEPDLARDYYRMQEIECAATEALSVPVLGRRRSRATIFIPTLIASADLSDLP